MPVNLNHEREIATILAALRMFQSNPDPDMTHFEECEPLSDDEIDDLCSRINSSDLFTSLKVSPIIRNSRKSQFSLKADLSGESGLFEELSVGIFDSNGECKGDIIFTVTEQDEPCVMSTVGGDGNGEHTDALYPLRPGG